MLYIFEKNVERRRQDGGIILAHKLCQIKLVQIRNFENF